MRQKFDWGSCSCWTLCNFLHVHRPVWPWQFWLISQIMNSLFLFIIYQYLKNGVLLTLFLWDILFIGMFLFHVVNSVCKVCNMIIFHQILLLMKIITWIHLEHIDWGILWWVLVSYEWLRHFWSVILCKYLFNYKRCLTYKYLYCRFLIDYILIVLNSD